MQWERARKPLTVLWMAAWFGLISGFMEASILLIQQDVFRKIIYRSRDFLWMAPSASVIVFLVPGVLLSLIAFISPRMVPIPGLPFFFTFLSMISLSLLFTQGARIAILAFSGVMAFLVARAANKDQELFQHLIQRTSPWMAGLIIVLVIVSRVVIQ